MRAILAFLLLISASLAEDFDFPKLDILKFKSAENFAPSLYVLNDRKIPQFTFTMSSNYTDFSKELNDKFNKEGTYDIQENNLGKDAKVFILFPKKVGKFSFAEFVKKRSEKAIVISIIPNMGVYSGSVSYFKDVEAVSNSRIKAGSKLQFLKVDLNLLRKMKFMIKDYSLTEYSASASESVNALKAKITAKLNQENYQRLSPEKDQSYELWKKKGQSLFLSYDSQEGQTIVTIRESNKLNQNEEKEIAEIFKRSNLY